MDKNVIYVYADWIDNNPVLIGKITVNNIRGRENISFEYDKEWLKRDESRIVLDPDIYLYQGQQYPPNDKKMFGIFSDSCPDRWGRLLINRKEQIIARKEERKPRGLTETDYLLNVYDKSRMGGLRFSTHKDEPFLSTDSQLSNPPWTTLRKLEHASYEFEHTNYDENEKWINMLLSPGSSLGGSRPKATVVAPDGSLWIAKFPSKHDDRDIGAWEMVAHDLAVMCHLNVPEAKLERFSDYGSTFLIKRFDRENGKRVHFASAMTLLGKTDRDFESGYLDIANFIKENCYHPEKELKELWHRIVFNIAVSNTDDHLRNHAFILRKDGWELTPVYDVNPSIHGQHLHLNISEYDSTLDFELAIETAQFYGIENEEANEYISNVKEIIHDNWRNIAKQYGLSRNEIMSMEPAFMLTIPSINEVIKNTEAEAQEQTSKTNALGQGAIDSHESR